MADPARLLTEHEHSLLYIGQLAALTANSRSGSARRPCRQTTRRVALDDRMTYGINL
jgi:hypothetical protein